VLVGPGEISLASEYEARSTSPDCGKVCGVIGKKDRASSLARVERLSLWV
jgi:hypothetical protein